MSLRRTRGVLLRLARRRLLSLGVGATLAASAAWLNVSDCCGAWWVDGLSLVLGATGAALLWTGVTGVRPDWIDETQKSKLKS